MKSRWFHLLVIFIFITGTLVTLPSMPVRAATWTVTNTNDSGAGSLREAIGMAGNGDTIVFSGVSGTITLSSQLDISNSITITGPGSATLAVSGGDAVRIFYISSGTIAISGLTITNGKVTDDYGGGIFKQSGTLTLDDVVITNNQAVKSTLVGFGGGIANYSGLLTITNSSLSYNIANNIGGAIYNYFDAGLSMTNVIVDHNQALADAGGGLGIRGPNPGHIPPPVTLDKVSITNNSAYYGAGGIYSDDSMTITNSLIANNSTPGYGGGLYFDDAGTGDAPITIAITNSTITGNHAAIRGGGGYFYVTQLSSSVTLNNSTIAANLTDSSSSGAGIYQAGTGNVNLKNTILSDNATIVSNPDDCIGTIQSLDYNLIADTEGCIINGTTTHNITGVSGGLYDLAQNGGPTETMGLQPASAAIDAGNDATCASTDQRGISRPQGAHCDMGAFEREQHTVTFDANGGTGLMTPQTAIVPTALTLNSFSRLWYSFSGWNTQTGGGGTAYADGATYSFAADITLYAQWTALTTFTVFLPVVRR